MALPAPGMILSDVIPDPKVLHSYKNLLFISMNNLTDLAGRETPELN